MYTVLRVKGDRSAIEEWWGQSGQTQPAFRAKLTRRGDLAIDLSNDDQWDEHQTEVENGLGVLGPVLETARRAGLSLHVDCGVTVPSPAGEDVSVVVRCYRLRASLLRRLADLGLDFETTVYVEPSP